MLGECLTGYGGLECCELLTKPDFQFSLGEGCYCSECHEEFYEGETCELAVGNWEGEWKVYTTCLICVRIRDSFFKGEFVYGALWKHLKAEHGLTPKGVVDNMDHLKASFCPNCRVERKPALISHDKFEETHLPYDESYFEVNARLYRRSWFCSKCGVIRDVHPKNYHEVGAWNDSWEIYHPEHKVSATKPDMEKIQRNAEPSVKITESYEFELREEDLKVEWLNLTRKVNNASNACHITHMPTGIVATCGSERSRHKNKGRAMQSLKRALTKQTGE